MDVQSAVAMAAVEALAAKTQGAFGVAILLDNAGNVLKAMHNNVVRDGLVFDPTAHGERQLLDWYFAEVAKGRALPPLAGSAPTRPSAPPSWNARANTPSCATN